MANLLIGPASKQWITVISHPLFVQLLRTSGDIAC